MKSKYFGLGILALAVIGVIFISGCTQKSVGTELRTTPTEQGTVTCNPPYIKVGTSCCLDQNSNNICDKDEAHQKPIKLSLSADYDSCLIKTKYTGSGIAIVETDAISDLEYYAKRGGIKNIGFEVLDGSIRDKTFQIEAKMLDSAGRTVYTNGGSFSTNRLYKTSKCDNCYEIPGWVSLPYQVNGQVYIKITTDDGKSFDKTIYIKQQDCITKKIVTVFNDLIECSESNKQYGENCQCFDDSCLSHRTTTGGYYPNTKAYITLIPGDRADKQKIINEINRRGFDFKFDMASNALPGFICEGDELSATKQKELYLLGQYYFNKDSPLAEGYQYRIFCSEEDR